MPLYEYKCTECDGKHERLRSYDRRHEASLCKLCASPAVLIPSRPAFTPSAWGDSQWAGRYDKGLGVVLRDKSHRDRLMVQRGLVDTTAYDQDNLFDKAVSDHDAHERTMRTYEHHLREANGDMGAAIANTFPGED
jgi:putative FmdB family regulatory protein